MQHPAKFYSLSLMFRSTSIVAGWCTRSFLYFVPHICTPGRLLKLSKLMQMKISRLGKRRTFGIGHQPLQNLLSTSIDLFHDTETLKTRLSDIYWEYFLEYYNELTSCTWHIRCGCPIGTCSVQKTTQTVTD